VSELQRQQTRPVTDILIEAGVVTIEQVEAALESQRETGLRVGEQLVVMGAATEEDIGWALAQQFGIPFVDIVPETIDLDLIRRFPEDLLRNSLALPLVQGSDGISVALSDPTDAEAVEAIEKAAHRSLVLCMATRGSILSVLDNVFGARAGESGPHADRRQAPESYGDRSGTGFLQLHVTQGLAAGAREVHFIPMNGQLQIEHRIDGRMAHVASVRFNALYGLLARIEALGGPVIDGSGDHASGRVICPLGDRTLPIEVSLLNCEQGIAVSLGLWDPRVARPSLETLGMDPVDVAGLREVLSAPSGLVIVSGPPGSMASRTMSALFGAIPAEGRLSVAIERPSGQRFDAMVRLALESERGLHMWEEMIVGQNADIVVIDDLLNGEAVSGVLSPAVNGRMLLASTDWTDSFDLLDELLTRRHARNVLAGRLRAVVQPRVIRTGGARADGETAGPDVLYEVLIIDGPLRDALRAGADGPELRSMAIASGFQTLEARAAKRVAEQSLTTDEAARILS
jgi:type II secretory ATPase GspE/PulE/Tfp pilus assembly ATPase PilB-like protein